MPVAMAYVVAGWLLLQVGDVLIGLLELPGWTGRALVALIAVGLPVALIVSWIYDWTPSGIKLTGEAPDPGRATAFDDPGPIAVESLNVPVTKTGELVGRRAECETLRQCLERAKNGTGGMVMISGEPGVGKSRLSEEALALGYELGLLPLTGHAYEERGTPFITTVEILEAAQQALPATVYRNVLGADAPEIAKLVPDLRHAFDDIPPPLEVPPDQQQRHLFNAVLRTLRRLSAVAPLVIVLDDLHWADESSMLLLAHIAPHLPQIPALFVINYRDMAADIYAPFRRALPRLLRDDATTRIPLPRLARDDVRTLLTHLGGEGVPGPVVDAIFEETSGNALFVNAVYRHLAEEGRLFDDTGRWRADLDRESLAAPESVRLVIEQRIERLSESTGKVLTLAAVAGLRFDLKVIEQAWGDAADAVLDAIEEAETAGFVIARSGQRDTTCEFSHALVRHALLDAVSQPRRQRLHLKLAQAMEALYAGTGRKTAEIAEHYFSAGPAAEPAMTLKFLLLAGREALATAAADEAVGLLGRALELAEDASPDQRGLILFERGMAMRTLGRWDAAAADWDDALPLLEAAGEAELTATICSERAYQLTWALQPVPGLAFVERGLRAVGDRPSAQRCRLLALLGHMQGQAGDFDGGVASSRAANAMAEQIGDPALLASDVMLSDIYRCQHYFLSQEAAGLADKAIALARAHCSSFQLSSVLSASVQCYIPNGRFDDFVAIRDELLRLATEYGDLGGLFHAYSYMGLVIAYRGKLDSGIEMMNRTLDREHHAPIDSLIDAMNCVPLLWRGAWDEADAVSARATAGASNSDVWEGCEASTRLKFLATTGSDAARPLLDDLRRLLPEPGKPNPAGKFYVALSSLEAAAMLGLRERAAALYPAAVQLMDQGTFCTIVGFTERFAGIAAAAGGHWDTAERHFDRVEALANRLGARVELAETLRWRAQGALWRGGVAERERAGALRAQAASTYAELGMHRHIAIVQQAD